MSAAPKDRPILAFCKHEEDDYCLDGGNRLTPYGAHCEGLSSVPNGWHVVVWGGGYTEGSYEEGYWDMPDYWFRYGSEFEEVAHPIAWLAIPDWSPAT
jgi:hypothetical protein